MRKTILVEGHRYPDGTYFEPGALVMNADQIPIVFNFDFMPRSFMGFAHDFERDENGRVTIELDIKEEFENLHMDLDPRVYVTQLERTFGDVTKQNITSCNLKAIGMCLSQGPWHPEEE